MCARCPRQRHRPARWAIPPALVTFALAGALAPSAHAACRDATGGWKTQQRSTYVERRLPGATRLRVALMVRRSDRRERVIVRLVVNRLAVVDAARGVALRAGRRTLATAPAARRRWRAIELRVDVRAGTVFLRVDHGRRIRVRVRLRPERRVRLGERRGRVRLAGVRIGWRARCRGAAPPQAPVACPCAPTGNSPPAPSSIAPAGGRPFAPTSVWNLPLADNAPLDAQSAVYVAELRRQLATTNAWINTTSYSTPVYTVPAGQPTVRVTLDAADTALQWALQQVPIPPGARPAAGTDRHLVVWQPSSDRMWELWNASLNPDGWHARWGGFMDGVSSNPGYFTAPHAGWGATATSLPLLGGLMRISELGAGRIDHALAFAIPHARLWTTWSWPAQRSDGDTAGATAIPEGARFRLPAGLNIDALGLPPVVAMMAKAVQRYGMVLRDKSGSVSFYAEDPTRLGADPYLGLFGTWPNVLLARFPWDKLQVLRTDLRGPVTGS